MAYEKMFKHFKVVRKFTDIRTRLTYEITNKNGYYVAWYDGAFFMIIKRAFTAEAAINGIVGDTI